MREVRNASGDGVHMSRHEKVSVNQYDGVVTMRTLPLAAGLLVASARRDPLVGDRFEFEIGTVRESPTLAAGRLEGSAILAFSCYAWNLSYSLEVARIAKSAAGRPLVVVGGPSIPRHPANLARFMRAYPWVDVLVHGEGELSFTELLRAWSGCASLAGVEGITFRTASDGWRTNAPRPRAIEFDPAASPYLDGTFDALLEQSGGCPEAALLETNRGCPFSCTFCDWGQAVGTPVHELPLERVEGDLEWITKRGIPYLYIVDANFGIRRRDLAIARRIGSLRQTTGLPASCFFHLTKNATRRNLATAETLNRASVACQVTLSMQDFDPGVLAAVKRSNITIASWRSLADQCHERRIPTLNELLLGLPEQTYDSFANGIVRGLSPHAGDTFHLYLCRLLENAELSGPASRRRYGIRTRMRELSDPGGRVQWVSELEEIVVATDSMPTDDWKRAFQFGFLASAVYNFSLLRTMMLYFQRTLGIDVRGWIEALLAGGTPRRDGVLGRVRTVLERRAEAILSSGTTALAPDDDAGLHGADAAAVGVVLRHHEPFLDEVADVTRDFLTRRGLDPGREEVVELFRLERVRTPMPARAWSEDHLFGFDWLEYMNESGREPPRRVPTTIVYRAPAWARAANSWKEFIAMYIAVAHAKTSDTYIVRGVRPARHAIQVQSTARAELVR
jgi:hypothetical protein